MSYPQHELFGLEGTMDTRAALLNAIVGLVEDIKAQGGVVDANAAAIHLSSHYQQSGMTINEIVTEIERTAVAKGVPLLSGNPPPTP